MLKYLFTAAFSDGSVIEQDQSDVSLVDSTKSRFYDVLQREDELVSFTLRGENMVFSVDLKTGRFFLNGVEMNVQGDKPLPVKDPGFRLIFYRQHQHDFNCDAEELDHRITYFIGWQTTIDEKNYQSVVGIK